MSAEPAVHAVADATDLVGPHPTPYVRIHRAEKSYGATKVLDRVDLDVAPGEVHCIIGPSGSGKSTLLRCINGLEPIEGGSIVVGDRRVGYSVKSGQLHPWREKEAASFRRQVGVVFQHFNLFPHKTALENVFEAPRVVLGRSKAETEKEALELLERVGLSSRRNAHPSQLSGGQQQRVAIARALAMQPKLMLFDEATSALDPELVGDVLAVMRDLASEGMTMIVVTHEIGFARDVGDHLTVMDHGRVIEHGRCSEVLEHPQEQRTQEFLRRTELDSR